MHGLGPFSVTHVTNQKKYKMRLPNATPAKGIDALMSNLECLEYVV